MNKTKQKLLYYQQIKAVYMEKINRDPGHYQAQKWLLYCQRAVAKIEILEWMIKYNYNKKANSIQHKEIKSIKNKEKS